MEMRHREREQERERERDVHMHIERERERERKKERERETETERERQNETQIEREREREKHRAREIHQEMPEGLPTARHVHQPRLDKSACAYKLWASFLHCTQLETSVQRQNAAALIRATGRSLASVCVGELLMILHLYVQ